MRRPAIIMTAVCLAILSGVLPMIVIYQFQRDRALQSEQAHVDEYARWTLLRADRVLADAKDTLTRAARQDIRDCSAAHIARLRAGCRADALCDGERRIAGFATSLGVEAVVAVATAGERVVVFRRCERPAPQAPSAGRWPARRPCARPRRASAL